MKTEEIKRIRDVSVMMNSRLSLIEVKGDSVELLFATKLGLKEIFEFLDNLEKETLNNET